MLKNKLIAASGSQPRFFLCFARLVYLTFSLPWYIDAFVLLVLAGIALRSSWRELTMVLASLIVAATMLQVVLSRPDAGIKTFYREHEKWARADEGYRPNVVDRIAVPHGDLFVFESHGACVHHRPARTGILHRFAGYRNLAPTTPARRLWWSAISSLSERAWTRRTLCPEVLSNELGLPAYSIGFPIGTH